MAEAEAGSKHSDRGGRSLGSGTVGKIMGFLSKMSAPETTNTNKFKVGDVVVGKIAGYPFWPGKITYDPATGRHMRQLYGKRNTNLRELHVTFFGDPETRGWVSLKTLFQFTPEWTPDSSTLTSKRYCGIIQAQEMALQEWRKLKSLEEDCQKKLAGEATQEPPPKKKRVRRISSSGKRSRCSNGQQEGGSESESREEAPANVGACPVCESGGAQLHCSGPCGSYFHPSCVGIRTEHMESFLCEECANEQHTCFFCKRITGIPSIKCSMAGCTKFLHAACAAILPKTTFNGSNSFVCPMHVCDACGKKTLLENTTRCIKCTTVFHRKCLPPGNVVIDSSTIVCSLHERRVRRNDDICAHCEQHGSLLCCDSCTSSFHVACLVEQVKPLPSDACDHWLCMACRASKPIVPGDVVLANLGSSRSWPAVVISEEDASLLDMEQRSPTEIPVKFLGTSDFAYVQYVTQYLEDEPPKVPKEFKRARDRHYFQALQEAHNFLIAKTTHHRERAVHNTSDTFSSIKSNKYSATCPPPKVCSDDILVCSCRPGHGIPCGDTCHNRAVNYECDPKLCPNGMACTNVRLQNCMYSKVVPLDTKKKGKGLFAGEDILPGEFIIEYVGEVLTAEECAQRLKQDKEQGRDQYYFITLGKDRVVDARYKGNAARFINHSCNPNCSTHIWIVKGRPRIGVFADKYIRTGEEITFDYNYESVDCVLQTCHCGASNCRGFITHNRNGVQKNGIHTSQDVVAASRKGSGGQDSAAAGRKGSGQDGATAGRKRKRRGRPPKRAPSASADSGDEPVLRNSKRPRPSSPSPPQATPLVPVLTLPVPRRKPGRPRKADKLVGKATTQGCAPTREGSVGATDGTAKSPLALAKDDGKPSSPGAAKAAGGIVLGPRKRKRNSKYPPLSSESEDEGRGSRLWKPLLPKARVAATATATSTTPATDAPAATTATPVATATATPAATSATVTATATTAIAPPHTAPVQMKPLTLRRIRPYSKVPTNPLPSSTPSTPVNFSAVCTRKRKWMPKVGRKNLSSMLSLGPPRLIQQPLWNADTLFGDVAADDLAARKQPGMGALGGDAKGTAAAGEQACGDPEGEGRHGGSEGGKPIDLLEELDSSLMALKKPPTYRQSMNMKALLSKYSNLGLFSVASSWGKY